MINMNESANDMRSNLTEDTYVIYGNTSTVRTYGLAFTLPLTVAAILTVAMTSLAMGALIQTKKTPKNVRILITFLLLFDSLGTVCFAFRRHISHFGLMTSMQLGGIMFIYLAYITVALMSLDRLIVFQFPNFYIMHVTFSRCTYLCVVIYVCVAVIYYFVRIAICAVQVEFITYTHLVNTCQNLTFSLLRIATMVVIIISLACYIRIILIVREKNFARQVLCNNLHEKSGRMKTYKSTFLVGVFLSNVILTGFWYILFLNIEIDLDLLRLIIDGVNLSNNIIDTAIYVLWFKECRMQILCILSRCFPSLASVTEKMKVDIFHVILPTSAAIKRSPKTEHAQIEIIIKNNNNN